jgi:hypothetical protein
MLKKGLFLFSLILIVVLTGCTKTDTVHSRKQLIGKWQIKSLTLTKTLAGTQQSKVTKNDYGSADYMQFNDDGTGYISISQDEDGEAIGNMTFFAQTLDENNIYVDSNGKQYYFQIMSINSATMNMRWGLTNEYMGESGHDTYTEENSMTLLKVK